jgi:hypothetical protein
MRHADSDANCDSDSYAYTDGYANCDSNSYAYADSDGYGYSNGYAYADSDGYGDSDGYAYTDSYANCDSNGNAYTDTYAYVDAYDPAETKPGTKATSDTAASAIGGTRKRLCGNSRENLASSPAKVDRAGESPKAQDIRRQSRICFPNALGITRSTLQH